MESLGYQTMIMMHNIISHGDHALVGQNRLDVVSDGQHIIQDIVNGGRSNVEGFL